MPSSSRRRAVAAAIVLLAGVAAARAEAQQPTQGFAVERFYPSAPTGGWLVMDSLEMRGGLGGAMALNLSYARNPLRVTDGVQRLPVVSDQAFADFGFALTYRRWRFYVSFDVPLVTTGLSGTVGDHAFTAPSVDLASKPDTVSDPRLGSDVRLVGGPGSRFRLGAGAQLWIPNGNRPDYTTDDTFRGMIRVLVAGDIGLFTYAAQLGIHIRPLDDSPAPGSPRGSELLFGVAGGAKLPVGRGRRWAVVVGPELFGATALRSFFETNATAFEALLSGRFERTGDDDRLQARLKIGVGAGLDHRFGAAEWRLVAGIELFGHTPARGHGQPTAD